MIPEAEPRTTAIVPPGRRRQVLGVRVDDLSWPEVLTAVDSMIADHAAHGRRHQIVTPNPEIVIQARQDEVLRRLIACADLVTCDGVGLRWAAGRLGQELRAVIPGSELTRRLMARHQGRGIRYFLLGAREGVALRAVERLRSSHPDLHVAGAHAGTPARAADHVARQALRAAGPIDVLLVAYGTPAQELWIARNLPHLDVAVAIGVGGTIDFLAGEAPWPPWWARRLGLIWLWRLVRQPWRWRRQMRLLRFVALVARGALRRATSRDSAQVPLPPGGEDQKAP